MTICPSRFSRRSSLGRAGFAAIIAVIHISVANTDVNAQGMQLGREDYGVRARVGYLGGDTVGRTDSLAHFELMPYLRTPNGSLMTDLRFFTGDGEYGLNAGVGYRQLFPEIDRIFGGIVWYDYDTLSGDDTQQITLSFETYGSRFDGLANIYIPVGDETTGSLRASNERFVGNELLFDQTGTLGDVLGGGDIQIGYLLPGDFAAENQIRAFAGAYHYTGTSVEDITGVMGRVEANFFGMVDGQIKVTDDDTFGTNVLFGISLGVTRGNRGGRWRTQPQDQLTRYPTRQYNAVVVNTDVTRTGVAAVNPDTGNALTFTHINSAATGGFDGTAEDPFSSLQLGLAEETDYHIVHGDSVFTGADAALTLANGDRLLGTSADFQHELEAQGVGSLFVPAGAAGSVAPILRGTAGDTVTLASNSELRGFTIENSGGNGIVFNGVDNAIVSDISVLSAASNGVLASDISGSVGILNTTVASSGAAALRIDNVTGGVEVSGEFTNDSGEALVLSDIGADADINLAEATFNNDTGNGLTFNNVDGTVALNAVSLVNSTGNGINIDGGTGTIRFVGETVIDGATGDAVRVHNSDAQVEFEALTIRDANGVGISVFNNTNTASLVVSGHTLIDGVTDGIRVQDNLGSIDFNTVEIDGRLNRGIVVDNNEGQFVVNDVTSIANSQGSTDSAIEISNSSADIVFLDDVIVTDATGNSAIDIHDNPGTVSFVSLDVAATDGAAFTARDSGTVRVVDGIVATENAAAFDIEDSDIDIGLTSVSVTGGDYGIRIINSTGNFVVAGTIDGDGSGGFINDTTTGIMLENARVVGVRFLDLDCNETAIAANGAERVSFFDGTVTDSQTAVNLLNIQQVELVSSTFLNNNSTFELRATADQGHDWLLQELTVDSGNNAALLASGTGDADVSVSVQSSIFTSTASGVNLLDVSSQGILDLVVSQNEIDSSGSNTSLLNIASNSDTSLGRFTVFNNIFASSGSSVTAVNTTTLGPSQILHEQNSISFTGDRGVGMGFNIAGSATVGISANLIVDEFDGATGILFENVAGPTRIEIGGNALDFANLGGLSDRGFIFEAITGDVTLLGTTNNLVSGASTSVFVPSGRTTGSFFVNGISVPQ